MQKSLKISKALPKGKVFCLYSVFSLKKKSKPDLDVADVFVYSPGKEKVERRVWNSQFLDFKSSVTESRFACDLYTVLIGQ